VLQRVKAVYRWAVIHERIEANPMLDLVPSEILNPGKCNTVRPCQTKNCPKFLGKLAAYDGDPTRRTPCGC
jgi:hypothetical protein